MDKVLGNNEIASTIALELLKINAIRLSVAAPFRWSSGWNSPIYCDNRLALSYPSLRSTIKKALAERIKTSFPDAEAIAGVATAGIPQGALVADEMDLPFLYVRSKPKGHGMENLIEGQAVPGQRVVVIEDLISTGGSSLKAVEALRNVEMEVIGLGAIFSYGFPDADEAFKAHQVPYFTLSNYSVLIDAAVKEALISLDDLEDLQAWRKNPSQWSPDSVH